MSDRFSPPSLSSKGIHTLVRDLKDRPQHLVLLLALVRGVLGVLHLVAELEEGVFDVVEALGRRLAVFRGAERRHFGGACRRLKHDIVQDMRWQVVTARSNNK